MKWAISAFALGTSAMPGTAGDTMITGIDGKTVSRAGGVETGRFTEGVGFSKNGKFLNVGDLADRQSSVFGVDGTTLKLVNTLELPGYPASLRTQVP